LAGCLLKPRSTPPPRSAIRTANVIALYPQQARTDRESLINDHVELARRVARHAACRVPSHAIRDDAESAGLLGLVEAADRFDPSRGVPFDAFARRRVQGAVLDFLRGEDPLSRDERKKVRAGGNEMAEPEFVNFDDLADFLGAQVDGHDGESILMKTHVRAKVRLLPAADQRLLALYYGEEQTLREVGAALGVTESRVCQRLSGILGRLRALLTAERADS